MFYIQGRPKEAVAVLSRAIDEVNADMATMRSRKQAAMAQIEPLANHGGKRSLACAKMSG